MKKLSIALFALATAVAIAPAAVADSFNYTFTYGSTVATGTLTGNQVAAGEFDITGGTITITGSAMTAAEFLFPSCRMEISIPAGVRS